MWGKERQTKTPVASFHRITETFGRMKQADFRQITWLVDLIIYLMRESKTFHQQVPNAPLTAFVCL